MPSKEQSLTPKQQEARERSQRARREKEFQRETDKMERERNRALRNELSTGNQPSRTSSTSMASLQSSVAQSIEPEIKPAGPSTSQVDPHRQVKRRVLPEGVGENCYCIA